jgi:hypothetical protein
MAEHTWIQEDCDGGYLGQYRAWLCTICGACGGIWKEPRRPFIPGPAHKVSEDCQEAQIEMRAYAEERITEMRKKWHADTGEHRHYASLFHDVLRWNLDRTNVLLVIDLIRNIEYPSLTENRRMPLREIHMALVDAGWRTVPEAVSAALEDPGEET